MLFPVQNTKKEGTIRKVDGYIIIDKDIFDAM